VIWVFGDMVDLGLQELTTDFRCFENFSQRDRKKALRLSNLSADIDDIVPTNKTT
jgi:hypothetical protein